jgi:hypothetical protein
MYMYVLPAISGTKFIHIPSKARCHLEIYTHVFFRNLFRFLKLIYFIQKDAYEVTLTALLL